MKRRFELPVAAICIAACLTYHIADGASGDRFYIAGSVLEVVYLKIGANGSGDLTQAYVSPASTEIYKVEFKVVRIGYQGDKELFETSRHGKYCDPLTLQAVPKRNIVIASMGLLTQPLSTASQQDIEQNMKALQHIANLQRGYKSKGLTKPGGFPPRC